MHTIHYTKHFLTGNLAGFAVPCEFRVPDADHAQLALESLATLTQEHPGKDCVTNNQFWVSFD
jgi:hypothetical protein